MLVKSVLLSKFEAMQKRETIMIRLIFCAVLLLGACGKWTLSGADQNSKGESPYRSSARIVVSSVEGIPGDPGEWICDLSRPDSVHMSDFSRRQFAAKWKWRHETWLLAGYSDSTLRFYRKSSDNSCTLVKSFNIPFIAASAFLQDVNGDDMPELWVMGYIDDHENRPGTLFFHTGYSVRQLSLVLENPEKLKTGSRIVSRQFGKRCEVSSQNVYNITERGEARLTETLYFHPDCKSDSARAILTYANDNGQITELPIVGTRMMVFNIFKNFYE